ncbi:MAG: NAD/FAD-dependent oxidoreductase, partial [Deltaproteobacteria bacterium]
MIAVIGASSSGLFAAWLLAQGGVEVEVFERNPQGEISSRR